MVENDIEAPLSIEDEIRQQYMSTSSARTRYEASPQYSEDVQKESLRTQAQPIKEQGAEDISKNKKSFIGEVGEFAAFTLSGIPKAGEEILEAFGAPDNLLNMPNPTDTADQIGQGLGQALTGFIPAVGAARWGLKLANLFQKSRKLTVAGEFVAGSIAGAATDAFAFDPRDPNAVDAALSLGIISKDSQVGAALKHILGQNDLDSGAKARAKAAFSGFFAGAGIELFLKGTGYAARKIKGKATEGSKVIEGAPDNIDGIPVEEIKEGLEELGGNAFDAAYNLKGTPDGQQSLKVVDEALPSPEEAMFHEEKRNSQDYKKGFEHAPEGVPEDVMGILGKLSRGEAVPDQDLDKILSVNLLKSGETNDMMNAIQFIAERIDVKDIAKPTVQTEDFDTVVVSMIDDFLLTDNVGKEIITARVRQVADNVEEAIKYVGTIKALQAVQTRQLAKLSTEFAKNPTRQAEIALNQAWDVEKALLFDGAALSKSSSDLLRAHQKKIRAIDDANVVQRELQRRAVEPATEVKIKSATYNSKLDLLDKIDLEQAKRDAGGTNAEDIIKTSDDVVEVSGKSGKAGRKRKFSISKIKDTPTGQRIAAAIKNLENLKLSLKRPERGSPNPKNKPVKELASPEQLKEIKGLEAEIKTIRADRAPLYEKFKKGAKEQLRLRKQFDKLADNIEKLRQGIDPRKTNGIKKPTTVDIEKLKAEQQRLIAKLKPLNDVTTRLDALNARFTGLLQRRLSKDYSNSPKLDVTQAEKDIQKAIKHQQDKIATEITNAEILEVFSRKAKAEELAEIDKMSFNQMRSRLAAMDRGFGAKTFKALSEIYVNGLLSSVKTIGIVNPLGTSSAVISSIFERAFAALRTSIKGEGDIDFKEVTTLAWGYMGGIQDAIRTFKKAMIHGPSDPNFKLDYMNVRDQAISKEAFNQGGNLGKAIDYIGTAVNMPGRLLLSTDEAFKSLIVRAESKALAYRKARNEIGSVATEKNRADISKRTENIMDNIFEHEDISLQAREAADKNTFTNPLHDRVIKDSFGKETVVPGLAKSIKQFIDQRDPTGISRIFIPFFQTPANIFQYSFDRTPLINKFSETLKQELKSTNLGVRELAEARMASSWVLWGGLFTLAMSGNFTGAPPRDPNLRKTLETQMGGPHWWSLNVGGGFHGYNKFDPFGLMLGAAATSATMAKGMANLAGQYQEGDDSDLIEEKFNEVLMSGAVGMAELIKNKSYIQGVVELMDIFSTDGRGLNRTLKRTAGFLDPTTSLYSSIRRNITRGISTGKLERLQDPEVEGDSLFDKTVGSVWGEIAQTFQEARDDVMFGWGNRFVMKDLAGNVVQYPGVNQDFDMTTNIVNSVTNPSPALRQSSSPLINKLAELEATIGQPSGLNKVQGVTLNDEEKSYIIDEWTSRNGAINATVKSKNFNSLPEGIQLLILENFINENKQKATQLAFIKFPQLASRVVDSKINEFHSKIIEQRPQGFQSLLNQGQ